MNGFFTKKEVVSKTRPEGKLYSCTSCGMYKDCQSPKMKPFGNFKKKILNIGEAPGDVEDKRGRQWQGKTGKLLERSYKKLGIDLFDDCLNTNAVNCHPVSKRGENRSPTNDEIANCRRMVLQIIEDYKPKVIVLLGNAAVYSLIGHRWKRDLGGITKWRGWTIPDRDFDTWLCPVFHPSYVERAETEEIETVWLQDLENVIEKINKPLPVYITPRINILDNDLSILNKISVPTRVAFDYETTGLKPHAPGHRIICAAIAISTDNCFAFMMPKTKEKRKPFIKFLTDPLIEKIAHNIKYEHTWSLVRLKTEVNNWYWDSMIATHILDNRFGITSLKFQVYVNFGVIDYSSHIEPFLQAVENNNANAINRIDELLRKPRGKEQLLEYCAYDSIYEYRLAMKQIGLMDADLPF